MGITDKLTFEVKTPDTTYDINYLLVSLPNAGNPTFYEAVGYLNSFVDKNAIRTPVVVSDISKGSSALEYFLTVLESDNRSTIIQADIKDSDILKNELHHFLDRYGAQALICRVASDGQKAHYHFK